MSEHLASAVTSGAQLTNCGILSSRTRMVPSHQPGLMKAWLARHPKQEHGIEHTRQFSFNCLLSTINTVNKRRRESQSPGSYEIFPKNKIQTNQKARPSSRCPGKLHISLLTYSIFRPALVFTQQRQYWRFLLCSDLILEK